MSERHYTARNMLQVTAFGSIQLSVDGQPIPLRQDQAFAVALMVAAGPNGLTRSELYRNLYGESIQKSGEQAAVMRVRRLRDRLQRDHDVASAIHVHDRFGFNPEDCSIDIWEFQRDRGSNDPDVLLGLAGRWAEPYADLTDEADLLIVSRHELANSYTQMMIRLAWMIEPGFGLEAVHRLESLIDEDPFNEQLVAGTAGAFYRLGRQTDATGLINDCRTRLRDEFGLNPGPHLDEIELALLSQDADRLASRRPSLQDRRPGPSDRSDTLVEPRRFVGRAKLVSDLSASVGDLRRPSGKPGEIHLITGPAGIGKTTLLGKLLASLDPADLNVRLGRVRSVRSVGPDGDVIEPPETYGLIVDALPELRPALEELKTSVDNESGRIRFWQKVHSYVQELAALQPTVVVLEDIHDADSQSLALLRYLVAAAIPSSLMVIMSARTEIVAGVKPRNELAAIVDWETVQTVELGPITQHDLRQLVALDHPDEATVVRERFTQRLWDLSQGHSMVASILSRDAPPGLDPLRLPDSLEWKGALASLLLEKTQDPDLRQLLSVAALLAGTGLEFHQSELAEIVGLDERSTEDLLTQARKQDICFHLGQGLWTFDHFLTLSLFDQQLGVLRRMLCAQLARLPLISSSDRVRYILGAGNLIPSDESVAVLMADAEELAGRMAFREAISALDEVLSLVGASADVAGVDSERIQRLRLDVLVLLAACHARTGNFDAAADHRAKAFAVAREHNSPTDMLRAALAGLPSGEYVGGDRDRLEMLAEIDGHRLPSERLADLYLWQLRLARICDETDLARSAAATIDSSPLRTDEGWIDVAAEMLMLRQVSTGERVHDQLADLAAGLPDGPRRAAILFRVALTALIEQRTDAVSGALLRAASEVRLHGLPRTRWSVDVLMAALSEVGMTELAGHSADPETARISGLRWGIPDVYDAWGVQLWSARWYAGEFDVALSLLDTDQASTVVNVAWKAAEALAAANVGELDRATDCTTRVCEELRAKPDGNWSAAAAGLLIETAVVINDSDLAKIGEEKLAPLSGQAIVLGIGSVYLGPVDRYLGLAAGLSDHATAVSLLTRARRQAERTGATYWRDRAVADLERLG